MEFDIPPDALLFADSARGVYIPQHFAESVNREYVFNVNDEQYTILESGPEQEGYWDVWVEVLDGAILIDSDGREWQLWHDGDLWLIPSDWQPNERN